MVDSVRHGEPGTHAGVVWDLAVLETWMASRDISVDDAARRQPTPQNPVAESRAGRRQTAQ
jgi:hypothetical protein